MGRLFDPRFHIKLSASPFDEDIATLSNPKMPMAGNDFVEVDLSTLPRHEINRFSQRMFAGICEESGIARCEQRRSWAHHFMTTS